MSGLADLIEIRAESDEERAVVHHLRGNCHNGGICPLCRAQLDAHALQTRLDCLISGEHEPNWVSDTLTRHDARPSSVPDPMRLPTRDEAIGEVWGEDEGGEEPLGEAGCL